MKFKFNYLFIISSTLILYSCYPGGAESVDDLDVSISYYDSDFDWSNLDGLTFTMPENIRHIKDGEDTEDYEGSYDSEILTMVTEEIEDKGLSLADGSAEEDTSIVVTITIIEQNNISAIWYPGYWWDGWYSGWYPGWGWGYYPWYPTYYNFKKGSIMIEMADYENTITVNETEIIPIVYEGALNGLIQGSTNYIESRITRGIEELFNQDPF